MRKIEERRFIRQSELRALNTKDKEKQDNTTNVEGYGLLFNTLSKDLGGFKEKINSNALKNVDLSKVYMLFNHDYNKPLASVEADNLSLTVDDKGLKFVAKLDNSVSYTNDVIKQIQNGNIKNCSFSFDVDPDDDQAETFTQDNEGNVIRTINQIKDVFDVSLVTIPAYDQTTVKVDSRSYDRFKNENKKEMEIPENMTQTTKLTPETRAFVDYVKTRGEKRDGLNTSNMGAVVPNSIMSEIKDLNANKLDLKSRVDVRQVPTGNGEMPVVDSTAVALSKEELAANPDLQNEIKNVPFKATTYAGQLALSSELIEDSQAINIKNEIVKDMATISQNTYNDKIAKVLNSQQSTEINTLDDLRKAIFTLDPRFKKEILMDTNMYSFIRTLKDNTGNYIMKDDTVLGLPITVTNLVTGAVVGDLKSAVTLFDRSNTTFNWQKFDSYSEGLALALRFDTQLITDKAVKHVVMASK